MRLRYFILLALLVTGGNAIAQNTGHQDSVINNNTIEVIQAYKPEIKQAPKPEFIPALPPADTVQPSFTYDVPQQMLYYTYHSIPLRPLALGRDSTKLPFSDYVKLGAGNLATIYADAGLSFRGNNFESNIHLHHISQQGAIKYQQTALSGLDADGTLHKNNNIWHAFINAERDQYGYYGYDHSVAENSDSLRQVFTSVHFGADMQNEGYGFKNFSYHPAVTASVYSDKFGASETTVGLDIPFAYNLDTGLQLVIGLNGAFTNLSTNNSSQQNNFIELTPGVNFHTNSIFGHAYLDPAVGQNSTYFLPDIAVGYKNIRHYFSASAGWQSLLHRNTFEELSTENPYMFDTFKVKQTKTDEVYGDVETSLGAHITLSGRLSWWQYSTLPLFLNDYGDQKQFRVVYDDNLNATTFRIGIRYQVANNFAVGGSGTFYSFYNGERTQVWGEPTIRIKGDLLFRPLPKLTILGYLTQMDGIYALNSSHQQVKLNPILDLGGSAEYNIIPRLSVFLQVNNLLNDKYQRWLGYQAYGFNIFGGIRLKF